MRTLVIAACVVVASVVSLVGQTGVREFDLTLTPEHVHWGFYDSQVAPVLRVPSGSRIHVETMVAGGTQRLRLAGASDAEIPEALKAVEARVSQRGPGVHPLTGPIYVEGAEPGDTLEVRIVEIGFLHPFGVVTFNPGTSLLPSDFPYAQYKLLRWKAGAQTLDFKPGVTLPIAPFWGSIGVAPPPLSGRISSRPPGWHGGNLDNKDLGVGATLFLPVHVPGALLSIGDGHALQAHGEVTGTAAETSLRGTIEVRVRKGLRLKWPRAETPTLYITMGLSEDLDDAARQATREMVEFLTTEKGFTRDEAFLLCSLAGDLHVTQAVDQTLGVHMSIAKSVVR